MEEKNKEAENLKEKYIEQECSKYESMTEGQLGEYLANNESDY